ncbi:inactive Ufm1-specific protease 1 isoform X2 [Protopterus annectens]|nr:inactive Ufm1-specific protease 1 isoform X2 [Protopterus annectens]XP_043933248.1 inactive Ufm1-specific protease 1 isoform X2 [Protopterus annectens]XP_043933249.1 inactive Ufm1-specific protease 1 isoform X2 [Protopterus annectens]
MIDDLHSSSAMNLVGNVHIGLPLPEEPSSIYRTSLVSGDYHYYHYGCDEVDDRGWGCGYRTLQTICSWLNLSKCCEAYMPVPALREIQEALVEMEDKPKNFIDSKSWIGSFEIALCLDKFYGIPCKILHVPSGKELVEYAEVVYSHFRNSGSPVMMGGDSDNSSKGILGICSGQKGHYLLVLDPHFFGKIVDGEMLKHNRWIQWRKLDSFEYASFYNFCLPQCKIVK